MISWQLNAWGKQCSWIHQPILRGEIIIHLLLVRSGLFSCLSVDRILYGSLCNQGGAKIAI